MFSAGTAAGSGKRVLLLEKNEKLGRKLNITGKGRCNVTNNCPAEDVLKNVPHNSKFLFSAMAAFPPEKTMAFFEENGCPLKTERGNRVFPVSDSAFDVTDTLRRWMKQQGVTVRQGTVGEILTKDGAVCGVRAGETDYDCAAAILCTGGCSYPLTGSDGSGYGIARALGHTIVEPEGSLVPLAEDGGWCRQMQGLSLRNISIRLKNQKGKTVYEEFGELLFTHFGLSGPVILSASAHMKPGDTYTLSIDLKPALDEKTLDARILRDFEQYQNRDFENVLTGLFPKSLIPVMVKRTGIPADCKVNSITRQQRRTLLELTKNFTVSIAGKRPVEDAIITSGGIKVSEVNPKTMESRLVPGLYFAGEILDVDAYTGGFNLQIAWATGRAAGTAAGGKEEEP